MTTSRFRTGLRLGLCLGLALALVPAARAADAWGTVKGQVVFDGTPPAAQELNVNKDQDHCLAKGKLYEDKWVVNKDNKGVRWVFVWLIADKDPKVKLPIHPKLAAVPADKVVLDQPCCMFEPHVVAVREGQVLVAKNSAPIPHNVNWQGGGKNPGDNKIIPPKNELEIKNLVASPTPVLVACNIHGWMKGYVRVFDHPYYAVTDKDGKFEIKLAPAGKYRLVVWHEDAGWGPGGKEGTEITIKADGDTDVGKVAIKPAP